MAGNISEQEFLAKVSPVFNGITYAIPKPKLSPLEREQRRLAFRNQIYVYPRTSAITGKSIISSFYPETPFGVVENELWFGDSWSGQQFAREFDTHSPVFAQLEQLRDQVPHLARSALFNENCDFSTNISYSKNCYLTFQSTHVHDSMYAENLWHVKDCIDCSYLSYCELCFECLSCENCNNLQYSIDCQGCSDSYYLLGCRSCSNCFGCANLNHQQYHIYNRAVSKDEFEQFVSSLRLESYAVRRSIADVVERHWQQFPRPHISVRQVEEADGNYLYQSRQLDNCFIVRDGESLVNCSFLYGGAKDCRDFSFVGLRCELMYECAWCALDCTRCSFCLWCLQSHDLLYCWHCVGCSNCFGCVGLRNQKYCLFNRQLTREEYELQVPQVIEYMQRTGEWGEFFPIPMSGVPYNHSIAQRYFPLSKTEALARNFRWYDKPLVSSDNAIPSSNLPDCAPLSDDPLIVYGSQSGNAFRITSEEQKRRRTFRAPLPREPYDYRLNERAIRLGGNVFYERLCDKTGRPLRTTFEPGCNWIVWHRDEYEAQFI